VFIITVLTSRVRFDLNVLANFMQHYSRNVFTVGLHVLPRAIGLVDSEIIDAIHLQIKKNKKNMFLYFY